MLTCEDRKPRAAEEAAQKSVVREASEHAHVRVLFVHEGRSRAEQTGESELHASSATGKRKVEGNGGGEEGLPSLDDLQGRRSSAFFYLKHRHRDRENNKAVHDLKTARRRKEVKGSRQHLRLSARGGSVRSFASSVGRDLTFTILGVLEYPWWNTPTMSLRSLSILKPADGFL